MREATPKEMMEAKIMWRFFECVGGKAPWQHFQKLLLMGECVLIHKTTKGTVMGIVTKPKP